MVSFFRFQSELLEQRQQTSVNLGKFQFFPDLFEHWELADLRLGAVFEKGLCVVLVIYRVVDLLASYFLYKEKQLQQKVDFLFLVLFVHHLDGLHRCFFLNRQYLHKFIENRTDDQFVKKLFLVAVLAKD